MEDLKNKLLLNNKKIDKEISDLNSNIESKVSQIENDKRTNLLNETALKKLNDEIHKKQQNVKNIEENNDRLITQNNSIQSNINSLDAQNKKLYDQKSSLEKEFKERDNENKTLQKQIQESLQKRSEIEDHLKRKQKELEQKRDENKKEKLRQAQNDRLRTNLESKYGSESNELQNELTKQAKDNVMLKKLRNDFDDLVKEIANLEELIKEKETKTQKNEELKKASPYQENNKIKG